jgi:hypothetical protein
MRKKISLHMVVAILLLVSTAQADTIRLKNGSIIKGKVTSFADDHFVITLDSGSRSKAMIYIADIAKIDFDAVAGGAGDPSANSGSTAQPEDNPTRANTSAKESVKESAKETSPPVNPVIRTTNSKTKGKTDPKPETTETLASKEPENNPGEKIPAISEPANSASEVRKPLGPNARTINVEVAAKRDWTSSGVIVKRGDRIRITSTGNITIDPAGQSSGPDGIESADANKLMGEKPTGGLIGVIGADNNDFVFIGRFIEFTATRDGLLFLSVNEGTLTDNSGSFKAVIEIQGQRAVGR